MLIKNSGIFVLNLFGRVVNLFFSNLPKILFHSRLYQFLSMDALLYLWPCKCQLRLCSIFKNDKTHKDGRPIYKTIISESVTKHQRIKNDVMHMPEVAVMVHSCIRVGVLLSLESYDHNSERRLRDNKQFSKHSLTVSYNFCSQAFSNLLHFHPKKGKWVLKIMFSFVILGIFTLHKYTVTVYHLCHDMITSVL